MYKELLDRRPLTWEDGVKYDMDTLRPHVTRGVQRKFLGRCNQFNRARRGLIEMVKWIGKFSLLLQRLRDAWMDMLPMSTLREEVATHERLFPFSDNLTTLVFIVASELSEASLKQ